MGVLGDILITNVSFGQDGIRIEYLEQRLQSEKGGVESALVLLDITDETVQLITDIQEALSDVVKDYFSDLRKPPDTLPNNRFQRRTSVDADDEGTTED